MNYDMVFPNLGGYGREGLAYGKIDAGWSELQKMSWSTTTKFLEMVSPLWRTYTHSSSILPLPSPSTSSDTFPPFSDSPSIWFLLRFQGQGRRHRKSAFRVHYTSIWHRVSRSSKDVVSFFLSKLIRRCRFIFCKRT